MRSQRQLFDPVFDIGNFAVIGQDQGGAKQVLVVSHHFLFYPTQVALLGTDGKVLRQYWHSGHIGNQKKTLRVLDFNGDGEDEIYLCGVSHGHEQATLVVLDPESFEGASLEEDGRHQLLGFPPGREMKRVLFPKSCMNRKTHEYNNAHTIDVTGQSLVVHVSEVVGIVPGRDVNVFYTLAPDLSLGGFETGNLFESTHAQMYSEHELDHCLSENEIDSFRNLTYFTSRRP